MELLNYINEVQWEITQTFSLIKPELTTRVFVLQEMWHFCNLDHLSYILFSRKYFEILSYCTTNKYPCKRDHDLNKYEVNKLKMKTIHIFRKIKFYIKPMKQNVSMCIHCILLENNVCVSFWSKFFSSSLIHSLYEWVGKVW